MELREKLLLRQLEVLTLHGSNSNKVDFSSISFLTDDEEKLLTMLRNYGSYQNIDCYLPYLENENEAEDPDNMLFEKSFDTQLMDNMLSSSIINMTLNESKELISKSNDLVAIVGDKLSAYPKPLKGIDKQSSDQGNNTKDIVSIKHSAAKVGDGTDHSKLKRNDTTTSSKKKTLKNVKNLTINSCNGILNLRHIGNLTINTCKQQLASTAQKKVDEPPRCKTSKSCDGNFINPECDFYKRLITENEVLKNHIVKQSVTQSCSMYPDPIATACMSPSPSTIAAPDDGTYSINSTVESSSTSSMIEEEEDGFPAMKKSERTEKIGCSTIGYDASIEEISTRNAMLSPTSVHHPPIIQCWLNKMFLEAESEPQNLEFLEISNII